MHPCMSHQSANTMTIKITKELTFLAWACVGYKGKWRCVPPSPVDPPPYTLALRSACDFVGTRVRSLALRH